jgi:CRP/FNR family cyclic AMP-dependent transcriptional regulator
MIQKLESLLAEHPFFRGFDPRYVSLIADCGSNVHFEAGQYIFHEGEPADRFYVIRHGRVALETYVPERGPFVVETVSEGDVLGWSWLFPPYRWYFDARAVNLTRAIALDGECLRRRCEVDYRFGFELTQAFAEIIMERLRATRLRLLDVYDRVAKRPRISV